ncbi:MAG: tRNA (adenosine(37)-N6)-dimethylallyltransferase MiaA [Lachnospiraceae bacterium]|nr:tRNA (adenosine(37)-N6)-dimethylallyltransferase MiaA [Lachnospiraceae bacterium]
MMNNKLVIIGGPTAVGKTKISIELAKRISGEIISADSMQVYKGMDIGTAKVTAEEMQGVPHHMIDILDPKEDFNVVEFSKRVKEIISYLHEKDRIPILVGGTGFYIQSVLYDIDFTDNDNDMTFRHELEEEAKIKGGEVLHERLKAIDPEAAESIHPNNVKRVIRALEFYEKSKGKISEHNKEQRAKKSPYEYHYFALTNERSRIYDNIEKRVDLMLDMGLVEEVRTLLKNGVPRTNVSMQGLGYKEIAAFIEGEISLDEAIYILKRDTRHFAKRQITWLKREPDVIWFDKSRMSDEEILSDMINMI